MCNTRCNLKSRSKDLEFNINAEDIKNLYEQNNGLCALSGIKMTTDTYMTNDDERSINKYNMSIDRIDSNKGYTIDNIQLICTVINIMKTDLPNDEFIEYTNKILEYIN